MMRKHRTRIIAVGLIAAFFAVIAIGIVTLHPGMGEPDVIAQNDKADETAGGGSDEHETDETADSGPDERETEMRLMGVYAEEYDKYLPSGAMDRILEDYPVNMPADELVTNTYDSITLRLFRMGRRGEIENWNSGIYTLIGANHYFGTECLRRLTDELVYGVYNLKDENTGLQFKLYVFFERTDWQGEEEGEVWATTGRGLFAAKRVSYSDFNTIHAGSSLEEVVEVDPIAAYYKPASEAIDYYNKESECLEYQTYHLLTDGILSITYTRERVDDSFMVKSLDYNTTLEVESIHTGDILELRVWEQDLPE